MIERSITFTDYNGKERTETFCFHLNKAEIAEWLTTDGDYTFDEVLKKITEQRNGKETIAIFKDLIQRSYGEKSIDGRRLIKTEEAKQNFMETEAYSELFMELCTDTSKAIEFVNGILPKDLSMEVDKLFEDPDNLPPELRDMLQKV